MPTPEAGPLTIVTQDGPYSYHDLAARELAKGMEVEVIDVRRFGDVIRATRDEEKAKVGVIAVSTVAGTVEKSVAQVVRNRASAFTLFCARVDLPIELALIAPQPIELEDLDGFGKVCLAQKEAWLQTEKFRAAHLQWIKHEFRGQSIRAVKEVIKRDDPNFVAIGPNFAAEALKGFIIGPSQINPKDSITSFYAMQLDPRIDFLPHDPEKTDPRAVISLAYPNDYGEFEKCAEWLYKLDLKVTRFLPFSGYRASRHNLRQGRIGGLIEVERDNYDGDVVEFSARINGLKGNDGVQGPFDAVRLGGYQWYPEDAIDLDTLINQRNAVVTPPHLEDLDLAKDFENIDRRSDLYKYLQTCYTHFVDTADEAPVPIPD